MKLLAKTQPVNSGLHLRKMPRVARVELTARCRHCDWLEALPKQCERVQHQQMVLVLPELVGHKEEARWQPVTVGHGTSFGRSDGRRGRYGKPHDVCTA